MLLFIGLFNFLCLSNGGKNFCYQLRNYLIIFARLGVAGVSTFIVEEKTHFRLIISLKSLKQKLFYHIFLFSMKYILIAGNCLTQDESSRFSIGSMPFYLAIYCQSSAPFPWNQVNAVEDLVFY